MQEEIVTQNHSEIQMWASSHEGKPQMINDRDAKADNVGIRIDFPGKKDDVLRSELYQDITWEKFFEVFEALGLAFVYSTKAIGDDWSLAYKFIPRENVGMLETDEVE